jgi:hypothetical protein
VSEKRALLEATTTSQMQVMPKPPPVAGPLMRPITTLGR